MTILIRPSDAEPIFGPASEFRVLVPQARTNGALSIVRQSMPARRLIPGHVHELNDVWVTVVRGRVGARVADEEAVGDAGCTLLKPRAIPHAMWNPDDEPNELLEFLTPGVGEEFFRGLAASAEDEDFRDVSARHGVRWFDDWTADLQARHGLMS